MTQVVTQAAVTSRRISVEHVGIPSERLFADVRLTLERVQPKYDARIAAALRSGDQENVKDCEARGPTLSIENAVDHDGLLQIAGGKRNALLYEFGTPLYRLEVEHAIGSPLVATSRCGWSCLRTSRVRAFLNMTNRRPSLADMAMNAWQRWGAMSKLSWKLHCPQLLNSTRK
jgi:hypothetical protein